MLKSTFVLETEKPKGIAADDMARLGEAIEVTFPMQAIDYRDHGLVEPFAGLSLDVRNRGVLELQHAVVRQFHVGNMLLVVRPDMDVLLPFDRETVFPGDMPFFFFPPRIAVSLAEVRPMVDTNIATFGDQGSTTHC